MVIQIAHLPVPNNLVKEPSQVLVKGKRLNGSISDHGLYSSEELADGAVVLRLNYLSGNNIQIIF